MLVVRFDVLTAMLLEIQDFWDTMFCQCLVLKAHALLQSIVSQSKNRWVAWPCSRRHWLSCGTLVTTCLTKLCHDLQYCVLYMNCAGLVQPANAEPCSSTADTEPSIPTADARIWWPNAILSSWSAAGAQTNVGAAGAVSHTPRAAGCQDAVGWSTFSKVRLAALGTSTHLTHTLHPHALHLQPTVAAAVVN